MEAFDVKQTMRNLEGAATRLVLAHGFFGTLALHMKDLINPHISTACTDGITMEVNPVWFNALTAPERVFIKAHESLHNGLGHVWRRGNRDIDLWNQAADYEINPILIKAGLTMPEGGLNDPRFAGMAADEIYAILKREQEARQQNQQQQGQAGAQQPAPGGAQQGPDSDPGLTTPGNQPAPAGAASGQDPGGDNGQADDGLSTQADCGSDPGKCGAMRDPRPAAGAAPGTPASAADIQDLAQKWEIAVEQAANVARNAGQSSADIKRIAADSKRPEHDWKAMLADFVTCRRPSDYTWSRPNRRFLHQGLYLPSLGVDALGPVVIGPDVSRSITQAVLSVFGGAVNGVLEDTQPERVHVLYWDTKVKRAEEFTAEDLPIKLTTSGGGGTDPRAVFEYIEREGIEPVCCIMLTDLAIPAHCFGREPDYPVLWISTHGTRAPWGQVVKMQMPA